MICQKNEFYFIYQVSNKKRSNKKNFYIKNLLGEKVIVIVLTLQKRVIFRLIKEISESQGEKFRIDTYFSMYKKCKYYRNRPRNMN